MWLKLHAGTQLLGTVWKRNMSSPSSPFSGSPHPKAHGLFVTVAIPGHQRRISCSGFVPELALGSQLSLNLEELWIIVLCPLNILSILSIDPFGRIDPSYDVVEIGDGHYRISVGFDIAERDILWTMSAG